MTAEDVSREHFRTIARGGAEGEALSFAGERVLGLQIALSWLDRTQNAEVVTRCWDAAIRSRALVENEMALRWRLVNESSADETVAAARERFIQTSRALSQLLVRGQEDNPEYLREVRDARQARQDAEKALAKLGLEFEHLRTAGSGLDEVRQALPENAALVAFAVARDDPYWSRAGEPNGTQGRPAGRYGVFVASRDGAPTFLDLGPEDEIEAAVRAWSTEIARGYERSVEDYRAVAESVRERVWDPIAPLLADAERVFVVPEGVLHRLSFAALPRREGGYLVEDERSFHYLTAERDLLLDGSSQHGTGVLLVGGLAYGDPGEEGGPSVSESERPIVAVAPMSSTLEAPVVARRSGCAGFESVVFEPLPGTGHELDRVVAMLRDVTEPEPLFELRGSAADELSLQTSMAGKRIVHLATHGFFLDEDCVTEAVGTRGIGGLAPRTAEAPRRMRARHQHPLRLCGLAVSGANARTRAPSGTDGVLTAEEIAALNLQGLEWAVLSACDTGTGDVRIHEGVLGLRRAFRVAGASTIIMSLWPVSDEATVAWMERLYTARLGGSDSAAAVQVATRGELEDRRASQRETHPFYWAGFVAAGDWR